MDSWTLSINEIVLSVNEMGALGQWDGRSRSIRWALLIDEMHASVSYRWALSVNEMGALAVIKMGALDQ